MLMLGGTGKRVPASCYISESVEVKINRAPLKTKQTLLALSLCYFLSFKVSCPGVFLPHKQDVYLGVYLLNQYVETDCFPSVFPVVIQQSMRFEKVILIFPLGFAF